MFAVFNNCTRRRIKLNNIQIAEDSGMIELNVWERFCDRMNSRVKSEEYLENGKQIKL